VHCARGPRKKADDFEKDVFGGGLRDLRMEILAAAAASCCREGRRLFFEPLADLGDCRG
jgi:hypothetical protein